MLFVFNQTLGVIGRYDHLGVSLSMQENKRLCLSVCIPNWYLHQSVVVIYCHSVVIFRQLIMTIGNITDIHLRDSETRSVGQ